MIGFSETYSIIGTGCITTIDIDGNNCSFLYDYGEVQNDNYKIKGIRFSVYLEGKSPLTGFTVNLIEFESMLKVVLITTNYNPNYQKKGIPESIIPEIGSVLKRVICSSSNGARIYKSYDDEQRVPEAEDFWLRLKNNRPRNVVYDSERDIYIYNPN